MSFWPPPSFLPLSLIFPYPLPSLSSLPLSPPCSPLSPLSLIFPPSLPSPPFPSSLLSPSLLPIPSSLPCLPHLPSLPPSTLPPLIFPLSIPSPLPLSPLIFFVLDRTVKIWDLSATTEVAQLSNHASYVRKVAFCEKSGVLFSASQTTVKVCRVE